MKEALSATGPGITTGEIVTGIETEFGIIRKDREESDPVQESMDLVKAYRPASFGGWAYEAEDPRADARGFRVDRLAQDEEEEAFSRSDRSRPFSFRESKSDRILQNGARFYNDHTHPEYSTPECRTLRDIVRYDRAGTEIVRQAKESREYELGIPGALGIYRNNTDFHGHSYGCHENYLLPRGQSFDRIVTGVTDFLVARSILLGAGKVGQEGEDGLRTGGYQLTQRADFMEERIGVDTMHRRPIVNSRDEPHADRTLFRRLHLICGDANMSEWQTAMKIGMTRLVLAAISQGEVAGKSRLKDPVRSFREISRSEGGRALLTLENGRKSGAAEILSWYREIVGPYADGLEDQWVLAEWDRALSDYVQDPALLGDRVDWVAKKNLLDLLAEEEGLSSEDPWLQSLDLAYHDIDSSAGIFWPLEEDETVVRLTDHPDVLLATGEPPSLGRPRVRDAVVKRFPGLVRDAGWERVAFLDGRTVDLPLFQHQDEEGIRRICRAIGALSDPSGLETLLAAGKP